MKKLVLIVVLLTITILIVLGFNKLLVSIIGSSDPTQQLAAYEPDITWLKVEGTQIKTAKGNDFLLKGVSSHGIQWYSDLLTYDNLKELKETWDINVFRIAMYTNENGYIAHKETTKQKLIEIADIVIDLDMYVIIDWHTLTDYDPNIFKEEAKLFFDEISTIYKDTPNVIYEICNEPNGNIVTWNDDIKPYADEIIPIIRKNSPNSLIIVGTPNWCKNLKPVAENPLNYNNILYSCHFYAATHKQDLRNEVSNAVEKGLPVIISEWGTTEASGNGEVDVEETKKWIDFLKSKNISFINWSFSNRDENSAIIRTDFPITSTTDDTTLQSSNNNNTVNSDSNMDLPEEKISFNDYLTDSGNLVKSLIKND